MHNSLAQVTRRDYAGLNGFASIGCRFIIIDIRSFEHEHIA